MRVIDLTAARMQGEKGAIRQIVFFFWRPIHFMWGGAQINFGDKFYFVSSLFIYKWATTSENMVNLYIQTYM